MSFFNKINCSAELLKWHCKPCRLLKWHDVTGWNHCLIMSCLPILFQCPSHSYLLSLSLCPQTVYSGAWKISRSVISTECLWSVCHYEQKKLSQATLGSEGIRSLINLSTYERYNWCFSGDEPGNQKDIDCFGNSSTE